MCYALNGGHALTECLTRDSSQGKGFNPSPSPPENPSNIQQPAPQRRNELGQNYTKVSSEQLTGGLMTESSAGRRVQRFLQTVLTVTSPTTLSSLWIWILGHLYYNEYRSDRTRCRHSRARGGPYNTQSSLPRCHLVPQGLIITGLLVTSVLLLL